VESGRYYWNGGMFVWRCDTVLAELAAHLPESHRGLMQIAETWNSPRREQVLQEVYPKLPKISIDYAVMEPAARATSQSRDSRQRKPRVAVVELPVQWLDVGYWPALAETLKTDEHNNATDECRCILVDSDDN